MSQASAVSGYGQSFGRELNGSYLSKSLPVSARH